MQREEIRREEREKKTPVIEATTFCLLRPRAVQASVVIQPYLKKGDVGYFGVNRNQYDRGHRGCAFMSSLYKLTGTDRQEGRQTGKIYYDKEC